MIRQCVSELDADPVKTDDAEPCAKASSSSNPDEDFFFFKMTKKDLEKFIQ